MKAGSSSEIGLVDGPDNFSLVALGMDAHHVQNKSLVYEHRAISLVTEMPQRPSDVDPKCISSHIFDFTLGFLKPHT